jgi:RNA 2',3'-cyclic 3'-phosphodiesterase
MKRCFLAIPVPEMIRLELKKIQSQWRKAFPSVNWVKPESIHLTVKFLGPVEDTMLISLQQEIAALVSGFSPFRLSVGGIGAFPSFRTPRVFWVGIQDDPPHPLGGLVNQVETVCTRHGFPREERGFHPHLTLGRVKRFDAVSVPREGPLPDSDNHCAGSFQADHLVLFQSRLQPSGAVYQPLTFFPFPS